MASRWWSDDDDLLELLKDALRIEREMPRGFVEVGKAAYVWRTIDAELAALTYDSAWDAGDLSAATRAENATLRALTFASGGLTIELEVTPEALFGQITPAQPGVVSVRVEAYETGSVPIDELGFFVVRPVPAEPFRLLLGTELGETVLTGWVSP
jgi:hypothetical protein